MALDIIARSMAANAQLEIDALRNQTPGDGNGGTHGTITGYAPNNVSNIIITPSDSTVSIRFTDPADVIWAGTKIVMKTGSYPNNETDGTTILDSTTRDAYSNTDFVQSGLTNGTTYYFGIFPYSVDGTYNCDSENIVSAIPVPFTVMGVSIDLTNPNPETAVTYTDGAVGMTAGSSDWDSEPIFKDIKPCVLKNGEVQYYLNPLNFAQKADGTAADITSGTDGDVMIEIPKTGFKINTSGDTLTVQITDNPNAGADGFKYYAHTRSTEGDRDKLYIGAYLAYLKGSVLSSLSDKFPKTTQTLSNARTTAKANGAGYDLISFYAITLLQCLFLVRYKNIDSQTALGQGFTAVVGNPNTTTGLTKENGMYYGTTSGTVHMKFAGIEDLWGNLDCWVDGVATDANRNILTAFDNFNNTAANYTNYGGAIPENTSNYMSKPQGTSETGFVMKQGNGSATTYFTDYAATFGGYVPAFGGYASAQSMAGIFRFIFGHDSTISYTSNLGSRIMYL